MKSRYLLLLFSLCVFSFCGAAYAQSGMTDQQVLEYVKEGMKQGRDQKQMASELARRGVTREQAERVKKLYEQQSGTNAATMQGTDLNEARLRAETADETTALTDGQPTTEELAREEILLEVPSVLLCSEDCLGLCPVCGQKRPCGCAPREAETDPRLSVLKQLLSD